MASPPTLGVGLCFALPFRDLYLNRAMLLASEADRRRFNPRFEFFSLDECMFLLADYLSSHFTLLSLVVLGFVRHVLETNTYI